MFGDYESNDDWCDYPNLSEQYCLDKLEEQRSAFEYQLRRVMDCLYGKIEFNLLESELEDLCALAELKYPECELMIQPKTRDYSFSKVLLESFSNPLNRKTI